MALTKEQYKQVLKLVEEVEELCGKATQSPASVLARSSLERMQKNYLEAVHAMVLRHASEMNQAPFEDLLSRVRTLNYKTLRDMREVSVYL